MTDPDLELRGGGGGRGCFALLPSVIFFFHLKQGGPGPPAPRTLPLDPPLTEGAGVVITCFLKAFYSFIVYVKPLLMNE